MRMVEFGYLRLVPLKVKDWKVWVAAKEAFELALSGLPAGLARCCWTEALEQMEKLTGRPVFTATMEAIAISILETWDNPQGSNPSNTLSIMETTDVSHGSIPSNILPIMETTDVSHERNPGTEKEPGIVPEQMTQRENNDSHQTNTLFPRGGRGPGRWDEARRSDSRKAQLRIARDKNGRIRYIVVDRGAQSVWLTMRDMDRLRSLLCQLNGYRLPQETENPELLRAIGRNGGGDSTGLVIDFEDLVCSVAVQIGQDPDELQDWPMEKFNRVTAAVERKVNYPLVTLAQLGGVKFRDGNPVPSWKFSRRHDLPGSFRQMSKVEDSRGLL